MESAVRAPLVGLREDDRREGLRPMPKRIAKAFRDSNRGMADTQLPLPFPPSPDFFVASVLCRHYDLVNPRRNRSCAYGLDPAVFLPEDCRFMPIYLPLFGLHMPVVVVK
jgi:hypothetical protein